MWDDLIALLNILWGTFLHSTDGSVVEILD